LTVKFDCAPAIGAMEGDRRRIRQAMLHLLNNALQYTPAGGTITLAATRTKAAVEISVDDTGIGIARHELTHVQQPFARGMDADAYGPGAGLGLTLVRQIAKLHGGDVAISSLRHRGTTVTLRIPLAAAFSMEKPGADG
jgi:signal transduction histidine kinase